MKSKYIPDLSKHMALCEANYARLLKLLPDIDQCQQRDFIIDIGGHQSIVSLQIQERFKFTTTVLVSQGQCNAIQSAKVKALFSPQLQVRLYHDAKMAEVINPHKRSQLQGSYRYPNDAMFHVDEKIQLNEYLAQWLSHCLTHGYQSCQVYPQGLFESE
ncbi:MAG: hypothetical protein OFPI_32970 [Osedax symbiont Rs2]|nr:MAG: hypothetical protein OFPI_32970 [Osedax symbiont Rs2]